jgi:hypothetical protein
MARTLFHIFWISMGATGLFAFYQVYQANLRLQKTLFFIRETEEAMVYADPVIDSLGQLSPAFYGSLFITLTAGACLFLLLATVVFLARACRKHRPENIRLHTCVLSLTLAALILAGTFLADHSLFHRIRDHLLLPNLPGRAVTHFYYAFSPYAAHAVGPLLQQQFKPYWTAPDIPVTKPLSATLQKAGWFAIQNRHAAVLLIERGPDNTLIFKNRDRPVITGEFQTFFDHPENDLIRFARQADPVRLIRFLCTMGLFMALPVILVSCLYAVSLFFIRRCLPLTPAAGLSGLLVILLFFGGILSIYPAPPESDPQIQNMLASGRTQDRILALKSIYLKKDTRLLETRVLNFPDHAPISEQYWMARALAGSDSWQSRALLEKMAAARSAPVAAAAVKSLSRRSCGPALAETLKALIRTNPDLYVQMAAIDVIRQCQ